MEDPLRAVEHDHLELVVAAVEVGAEEIGAEARPAGAPARVQRLGSFPTGLTTRTVPFWSA